MEMYLQIHIVEITYNLDINIQFFNAHIFTSSYLSNLNSSIILEKEKKYLVIIFELQPEDCDTISDFNKRPIFFLILDILSYLTKEVFNPNDFKINRTIFGKTTDLEKEKFIFNDIDYYCELRKFISLLNSDKKNKIKFFCKKLERHRQTLYTERGIEPFIYSYDLFY